MANHTYKNWLTLCVPRVHPLSLVVILCKQCRFKPCNIFRYNPFPVTNTISFWLMLLSPPSFTSPPRSNWWISYQWQTMQGCIFQAPPLPQPRPGSSEFLPFSNLQIQYLLKVIITPVSFYSSSRILYNVATGHWPAYSVLFSPSFQTIAKIQSNFHQSSSANYCQYFSSQLPHSALMCSALHPFTKLNSLCVL